MSSSNKFIDLAVDAFAESVAEPKPAPAGGSVAATIGALGAGLVSMAFRLAAGTTQIPEYMAGRADELDDLRELLIELVDRDAEAYAALVSAGTADSEDARKARSDAFEAPLETAEFSVAALRLLVVGAAEVPKHLASDLAVGEHALRAAIAGGLATAEVNLAAWPADDEDAAEHRATIDAIRADADRLFSERTSAS